MVDHGAQVRHLFQHREHVGQMRGPHEEVKREVVGRQQAEMLKHARPGHPGVIGKIVQHRADSHEGRLLPVPLEQARKVGIGHIEPADDTTD